MIIRFLIIKRMRNCWTKMHAEVSDLSCMCNVVLTNNIVSLQKNSALFDTSIMVACANSLSSMIWLCGQHPIHLLKYCTLTFQNCKVPATPMEPPVFPTRTHQCGWKINQFRFILYDLVRMSSEISRHQSVVSLVDFTLSNDWMYLSWKNCKLFFLYLIYPNRN